VTMRSASRRGRTLVSGRDRMVAKEEETEGWMLWIW